MNGDKDCIVSNTCCIFVRNWPANDTIRYDTVDLRALKSWRDGQLNLVHGPETKSNEKIKIKNQVAQEKRCRQKSVEAVREEEVKLRGVGFVKEVGFKPGVKERHKRVCRYKLMLTVVAYRKYYEKNSASPNSFLLYSHMYVTRENCSLRCFLQQKQLTRNTEWLPIIDYFTYMYTHAYKHTHNTHTLTSHTW